MKWVIRRIQNEMYVVSPRLFVINKKFARRFSTRKQAEAYMISCSFNKKQYIAEEIGISANTTE
ncbi:hypothetical protein [Ruminococcus flavefaciens]|uniref:hypothetical protein n=1 Tax=Ruminococcus flavefaciens TaxID=1265 RepID=UPI0026F27563|nr:hypothetical protein [Ruminococcus flavefaciens]MDD7517186.1 hypothetical protein [Ruminococcus flavefaciens]MDY5690102.1 hypothetical protein [Ruminococcus flavefaciens]